MRVENAATRTEMGDPVGEEDIREEVQAVVAGSLSQEVAAQRSANISGDDIGLV